MRATVWGAVPVRWFCSMIRAAAFLSLVLAAATATGASISGVPSVTRIYHVPGGPSHAKTRIDRSMGERWFCSEAESRSGGWRRSKR